MESELAVEAEYEGIMFSRISGLQPLANSYPIREKLGTTKIGTW